jgi:hypothetical protein
VIFLKIALVGKRLDTNVYPRGRVSDTNVYYTGAGVGVQVPRAGRACGHKSVPYGVGRVDTKVYPTERGVWTQMCTINVPMVWGGIFFL